MTKDIDLLVSAEQLARVREVLAEVRETREVFELESQRIHVVSIDGLIRMKQVASRPQDLADIDDCCLA